MEQYTVDRLEDQEWAVIEDQRSRTLRVPVGWLPPGTTEGHVISVSVQEAGDGARLLRLETNSEEKAKRLKEAQQLREGIKGGPSGDVSL